MTTFDPTREDAPKRDAPLSSVVTDPDLLAAIRKLEIGEETEGNDGAFYLRNGPNTVLQLKDITEEARRRDAGL